MQKITYSKEYMHNLYNGSDEDIHFVLTEFTKGVVAMKAALVNSYSHFDSSLLIVTLHKYYSGFAYAGFPQISSQIKSLMEICQKINNVEQVYIEFNKLLISIDQCNEICLKQIHFPDSRQNYV